jgi:hypothetical protein
MLTSALPLAVRPDVEKQSDHWFLAPCITKFLNSFLVCPIAIVSNPD